MTTPAHPAPPTARRRHRGRVVAVMVGVGLVLGAAAAGRFWRSIGARDAPTGPAQWIWIERSPQDRRSAAFFAVADFRIDGRPPERAELSILADEEYLVVLNGHRVGSGIYRPGAPLDTFDVAPLLATGTNRVVVELRSGRGAGGLLASLRAGETGRTLLATDGTWRVFAEQESGLFEGDRSLDQAPRAAVWGLPPTGRWGRPHASGTLLPLYGEVATGGRVEPEAVTSLGDGLAWQPYSSAARFHRKSPAGLRPGVAFDFGREVFGYLNLVAAWRVPRPAALLFAGDRPLDPLAGVLRRAEGQPSAVGDLPPGAAVLTVDGRRHWSDAVPRRLRYAAVLGWRGIAQAWVDEVDPAKAQALPAAPSLEPTGVFGVEPPPQRTPLEDEVRREIQRLADLSRRAERLRNDG